MTTNEKASELFGENLDSTIFTWQNYCGTVGVSVITIFDDDNEILNPRFTCEGWCKSDSLIVKSRKTGVAIMLWDKKLEEQVWCHMSEDLIDTMYLKDEISNRI